MVTRTFFGELVGDREHTISPIACMPVDACQQGRDCLVHSVFVTHPDFTGSIADEPMDYWFT